MRLFMCRRPWRDHPIIQSSEAKKAKVGEEPINEFGLGMNPGDIGP